MTEETNPAVEALNDEDLGYSDEDLRGTTVESTDVQESEPEPEVEEAQASDDKEERGIPPGLFAETRKQNAELKNEIARLRNDYLSQVQELRAERQQAKQPEVKVPDKDEDPLAYMQYQNEQLQNQLNQMQQQQSALRQQEDQQKQYQQVVQSIAQQENQFKQGQPDYEDALKHYRDVNLKRLTALGFDQATAQSQMLQQEFNEALLALQYGQNPAEYIYNTAKTFGYKTQKTSEAEKKLDSMEKGKKAQSLGPSGMPDVDELLDMDDATFHEFEAAMKDLGFH